MREAGIEESRPKLCNHRTENMNEQGGENGSIWEKA